MSAEIVNLRMARKRKARSDREAETENNRRKHGRTKEEKQAADRERSGLKRKVDGHRLSDGSQSEDLPKAPGD